VVSIGPVTSATARELGLTVHVEAERHDIDGLVDALLADAGATDGRG
jgi:uroporphyrinogen III methyltransferase/synthase